MLMSDGVYETLQESTNTSNPNHDVAKLVSHELMSRASIQGLEAIAHRRSLIT